MIRMHSIALLGVFGSLTLCLAQQAPQAAGSPKGAASSGAKPYRLFNPDTLAKPAAGYSQVAEITGGKLVFIAGQVAQDKAGILVGKDDFRAQVEQVFSNLKLAVEAAGGEPRDLVKLNIYIVASVTPEQLPAFREIRDKYVNTANPPTSTLVFVSRLARPELLLEVDAVAAVPSSAK
jgi:enamine deaminase RidA (YjgF/YER057c/UK114 family)